MSPDEVNRLKVIKARCEADLLFFTRYFFKQLTGNKFVLAPLHDELAGALQKVADGDTLNLVVNIPPRYGKAIDTQTDMLTKRGWVKAGEVKEGDYLLASDGGWTKVTGVFPQGALGACKVRFSDGSEIRCCEEHLWTVQQRYSERKRTRRTKDLLFDTTESDGRKKWRIPVIKPIIGRFDEPLPIDPYLFGCWLGDGDTHNAGLTTADPEIAEAFRAGGYDLSLRTWQNSGRATQYGIRNRFITRLRELGVVGNKHIPDSYAQANAESRLALLQGLCDTDGTCGKNGQQSFSNSNPRLVEGVKFLISSLGGIHTTYIRTGSWTVHFRLPEGMSAFRLARKAERLSPCGSRTQPRRFIDSILPDGHAEMVCFSVSAEDKLFAAGRDLVLTHNTELAVVSFIAWSISKNPKAKFIHLSYSDDLALDNSSRIKELIESDEFQELWPTKLKQDSKSKKKWYTEAGGGLYATAAGGAITGFGAGSTTDTGEFAGAIVIDDPLKVDDAYREIERNKVNRRLNGTIKSRRNSRKTPIIIIMQRLHEEDMTGFVMSGGMGEPFEQVKLKALRDDGTALWPFKHTVEELIAMRKADPFGFSGQYQQEPSPDDGEFFKREWIRWYEAMPKHLRFYGASDYAVSENGDYTVHLVVGIDPNDDIYIVDIWRDRQDSLVWVDALIEMILIYKPLEWGEGSDHISKSLGSLIDKRQREEKAFCYRKQFAMPRGGADRAGKMIAAQAIRGRLAQGKVYFPKHKPWVEGLVSEMLRFPAGKHDDQVDCLAIVGRMLTEMVGAEEPRVPAPPRWERTIQEMIDERRKKRTREED